MKDTTKKIFENLFCQYAVLDCVKDEITSAYEIIRECYSDKKKTLICGNGGSASDSEHIVGELMKGFMLKRPVSSESKNSREFLDRIDKIARTAEIFEVNDNSGNSDNIANIADIAEKLQEPLRSI